MGGDVVVMIDGIPCHVLHAELLPLVNERRAAQRQQYGGDCLCRKERVRSGGDEMIDGSGLVVILEKNRTPAVFLRGGLARGNRRRVPGGKSTSIINA